ncbi:coiled-coil domain-containing protein 157-like [Clavelina lepadiformis]|uniref:coiled-coil domain-containing protein 157-like n=1 Tax=Clavelina lepadiformis TaxID=159417 RepID=UPI0040430C5C
MTQLLGTKYCLESLQHDIKDVQDTIVEIISRVGSVQYQSWKFPDKHSMDVDVDGLLSEYAYEELDEERNEVVHVMLYDLLIDRLLFLFHCFTYFNEILLSVKSSPKSSSMRSISAGLTVKRSWGRLAQVAKVLKQFANQIEKEQLGNTRKPAHIRKSKSSDTDSVASDASDSSGALSKPFATMIHCSSQTSETAYVVCEVCDRTQTCLHEVGKSLVHVCKSQGLPTALEDYIAKQTDSSLMSIAELSRWKNLQKRDLSRIDRHLDSLMKQINPLKQNVSTAEKNEQKFKEEIARLQSISGRKLVEFQEEQRKYEYRFKENEKSLQKCISCLSDENEKLREEVSTLKSLMSDSKEELFKGRKALICLDNVNSQLKHETEERKECQAEIFRMKTVALELQEKLRSAENTLNTTKIHLEKEISRSKTIYNREEVVQKKHQSILIRFDELNEECEALRERLAVVEEEHDEQAEKMKRESATVNEQTSKLRSLEEQSSVVEKEKETMQKTINDLRLTAERLEEQVEKFTEREKLLVSYPDLQNTASINPTGTGDIIIDMEQQIKANNVRIDILKKENVNLMQTLSKISSRSNSDLDFASEAESLSSESMYQAQTVQLWKKSPSQEQWKSEKEGGAPARRENTYLFNAHSQSGNSFEKKTSPNVSPLRPFSGAGQRTNRAALTPNSRSKGALLKPWT